MGKNSSTSLRFVKFWLPVYLYAILIFVYSSMSSPPLVPKMLHGDKLLHLLEYAVLGYLIARAFKHASSWKLYTHFRIFAIGATILYGLSDELHQYFVPGREADLLDIMADAIGGAIGQLFIR